MSRANIFYLISSLTILGIRLGVFLFPRGKIRIAGIPIHHFWIGLLLIIMAFLIPKAKRNARLTLFSFGFAGVADELAFMLRGNGTLHNYWSLYSVCGVVLVMVAVFLFKGRLVKRII